MSVDNEQVDTESQVAVEDGMIANAQGAVRVVHAAPEAAQ